MATRSLPSRLRAARQVGKRALPHLTAGEDAGAKTDPGGCGSRSLSYISSVSQEMSQEINLDAIDRELEALISIPTWPVAPRAPSPTWSRCSASPALGSSSPTMSLATLSGSATPVPSSLHDSSPTVDGDIEMRIELSHLPLLLRLPRSLPRGRALTYEDGLVGCEVQEGRYLITSPNMDYIPYPVYGEVTVVRQWNGHFGVHDPLMWPQLYIDQARFRWLMAIPRRPSDPESPDMPMWNPLLSQDIIPAPNSVTKSFFVVSELCQISLRPLVTRMSTRAEAFLQEHKKVLELESLLMSLKAAFRRLDFPSSQADIIRQYSCVQRYWLMIDAWIEFHVHLFKLYQFDDFFPRPRPSVRTDLMGAFTNIPDIAERMFRAGIPVWFVRVPEQIRGNEVVKHIVEPIPAQFQMASGPFPNTPIFQGWAGEKHMLAIATHAHVYRDLDAVLHPGIPPARRLLPVPLSAPATPAAVLIGPSTLDTAPDVSVVAPVANTSADRTAHSSDSRHRPYPKKKPKKAKGQKKSQDAKNMAESTERKPQKEVLARGDKRTKFEDVCDDLYPPRIPAWQDALWRVDRSRPAPHDAVWRYWVPEPLTLISSTLEGRTEEYLTNWMRMRDAWFWILNHEAMDRKSVRPLRPQEWRDYLNMKDFELPPIEQATKSSERRREVYSVLQRALGVDKVFEEAAQEFEWYGKKWVPSSVQQTREILWELCEVGFRCELTELDRHMVPNKAVDPDVAEHVENFRRGRIEKVFGGRPLILSTLPTRNEGLAASDIKDRVPSLEALRVIMHRWPDAPEEIKSLPPLTAAMTVDELARIEVAICSHYAQRFYDVAGRAAILPRQFPCA
ncbi:hypothetical protein NM688_g7958 [Phlebia brevispora]|uniref:Uncharacterized protein n=1 Tax=Phlebia brevispora TaxID=194682 RepID=A0ACC1RZ60_9APHY|nr:hypothetical protein NM688_g7958 [Phlebia brevispora]